MDTNAIETVEPLLGAIRDGHWLLGAALAVVLLTGLVRRLGGRLWPPLASGRAALVTSFALALATTVAQALVAGAPFSLDLLVTGLIAGATASGLYDAGKAALPARSKPRTGTIAVEAR